jgi:hypothetical protein
MLMTVNQATSAGLGSRSLAMLINPDRSIRIPYQSMLSLCDIRRFRQGSDLLYGQVGRTDRNWSPSMKTATFADQAFTTAWEYLLNLSSYDVPTDLSEITESWVFFTLEGSDDPNVEEAATILSWKEVNLMAYDLRDIWHDAKIEQMQWEYNDRYDYI